MSKFLLQNHFDGFKHHGESVEITVEDGFIANIRAMRECEFPTEYWMPQFVNAHCHLELSALAGKLQKNKSVQDDRWDGDAGKEFFFEWLGKLRELVADWTKEDYRASYRAGLELAENAGTSVIYDVGNQQAEFMGSGVKLFAMHEVIKRELSQPCTPHSIYATPPELVRNAVLDCIERDIAWSIHLAEFDERDTFGDFLKIFWKEISDPAKTAERGLPKNGFVIHGNFLTKNDLTYMSKNNIALVHCPQSHEWFAHRDPDFEMWKSSGVDLCIATDSLASADSLNLLDQLKTLFRRYPTALSPEEAFASVTSSPAKYLGGSYGKIAVGSPAKLQKFALPKGTRSEDALRAVIITCEKVEVCL